MSLISKISHCCSLSRPRCALPQALTKLDHPNIVTLYATFQDSSSLYYVMEYLDRGELWSAMFYRGDPSDGRDYPVGLPLSMARFCAAELINAIEYIHRYSIMSCKPSKWGYERCLTGSLYCERGDISLRLVIKRYPPRSTFVRCCLPSLSLSLPSSTPGLGSAGGDWCIETSNRKISYSARPVRIPIPL